MSPKSDRTTLHQLFLISRFSFFALTNTHTHAHGQFQPYFDVVRDVPRNHYTRIDRPVNAFKLCH